SGPNGSGKSNILDAIIFAMGENRPKTMRVDKLRSLMHDIEGNRRGPKMARASVHFDNTDRKIPVDSDNVEITREMDDKGENNYYLNKKKTNRTQILDLLDVANAGLNQLNAVQQGTVTRISEFTPEEKRQAIENLIGLSYFDEKKAESQKQLEEADRRLEIALARMDEIKKRIDELEEERNLKMRYDFLERELNRLNAISAANKMRTVKSEKLTKEKSFNEISAEVTKLSEEREIIRKEIQELDGKKLKFMDEVNAYNQAKATIDTELSDAMQQFEETNSGIVTAQKRIQQIDSHIPEIKQEIQEIHQKQDSIKTETNELSDSISQTNTEKQKLEADILQLDAQRNKVLQEQSHVTAKKVEVDRKIKDLREKLNSAKLALSQVESEIQDIDNKIVTNNNKKATYEVESQKLAGLKNKLESVQANHQASITELKSRISQLISKREKFEKDIEDLSLILDKSSNAAAQYEAKIKVVKSVMHEDYSIAKLKEESDKLGIEGLVYEMITWDKQYERAVLAAGTDWIKAIVVKDFATLLSLAEIARDKKLPKLKIIPLDAIPNFKLDLPQDKGIIGILSDYVKCDSQYSALKTFLFGNVILTDSRSSAYRISKAGYKAVTVEGEFFESKSSAVIVDINSKISKLTKIISMSTSVDGLLSSISLLKRYIQKKKTSLKKLDDSIENHRERLSTSETGLATTKQSLNDLIWKLNGTSQMSVQLGTRNTDLEQKKSSLKTEIVQKESYVSSLEERIEMVQENYAEGEQTRIANELSRLNERKASLDSKMTSIMAEFREKSSKLASLNAQESKEESTIRNLNDEILTLESEKQDLTSRIANLEQEKVAKNESLIKLREKEQELISTSGTSVSQLKEYDDKLKELNDRDRSLTKDINSYERQTDSLSRDLRDLTESETKLNKLLETFGFDESISTFDVEPLLLALSSEQRSLTALNAKAPETYIEVSDGYRSMSTRKNSLEQERNSIVKFIEEIEKDKRQTFLDAFDKVDKEIRHIFTKMTGGNAWLELQNEDDIFNTGISYLIQFPNKPKRESTSISGGEKTLAAIVFVLALQKLKPSPFYLFDEVDAHLDAPNSERLSKILEERSKESQFIMVSLKDSVVQKAQLIYGVYPKNGVSQVVTYKDKRLPSMAKT
ncbi:chromosome partitioning protein ParA, partial [Nitrosopumilus sp. b1]|uniref:chromosome segregation SMC family protein n=1 Tax=Nitrosopumilus sp. b1 TaxID=2109907 RepID=UPI0015F35D32